MTTHDEVSELAKQVLGRLLPGILVRTQEARFWSSTPDDDVLGDIVVSAGIDMSVFRHPQSLDVRAAYTVDALRRSNESGGSDEGLPAEGWRSSVVLHGQWHVEDAEKLSDDQARSFAVKVGLMTLHPYARAHVQSAVISAGWPTFTLDVLTAPDDVFVNQQEPDQVDLSLISLG